MFGITWSGHASETAFAKVDLSRFPICCGMDEETEEELADAVCVMEVKTFGVVS